MSERVRVFMSPSDHGEGQNKCLHSGCYEDKHTRPVAEVCAKHLENSGIDVMIGTAGQSLSQRCRDSDNFGADLHVPIHTNAWNDPELRYLMFMFYADTAKHRKLFNAVAEELEAVYPGNVDSEFRVRTDLGEITMPKAMTLYCELGFHTNKTDSEEFIHNPKVVGKALAKGICKYLGIAFREYVEPDKIQSKKTCTVELPVLKKGDSGRVVKAMQGLLIARGYSCGDRGADGDFGDATEKALHRFKTDNDLKVTSNCGAQTWAALLCVG